MSVNSLKYLRFLKCKYNVYYYNIYINTEYGIIKHYFYNSILFTINLFRSNNIKFKCSYNPIE